VAIGGVLSLTGSASGTTVQAGGSATVASGGTLNSVTLSGAARVVLATGAKTSGSIVFTGSGGTLVISGTTGPVATISGLTADTTIDLPSFAYGSAVSQTLSGGVLKITSGVSTMTLSLGGALGGVFCALLAPMIFPWPWEHPLLLLVAAALLPGRAWNKLTASPAWRAVLLLAVVLLCWAAATRFSFAGLDRSNAWPLRSIVAVVMAAALALLLIGRGDRFGGWFVAALAALMLAVGGVVQIETDLAGKRQRSFFGVYTVDARPKAQYIALVHGTTMHGAQSLRPELLTTPMTYYLREAGIGRALAAMAPDARIGVVGLGTGTLACHAKPGQRWTAWEIDPLVVAIARQRFSYIARCKPDLKIVVGDARLTLADAPPAGLDLLAIDAFSSDAIPLHLMTAEAFALYGRALADDGVLMVHISNRFLNLEPVLAAIAGDGGWQTRVLQLPPPRDDRPGWVTAGSTWVALSRSPARLDALVAGGGDWRALESRPGMSLWRDDFASVLPVLRWRAD
jgi:hypothetical protein